MTEIIHATTISSLKKDQSKAGKARSMDKVHHDAISEAMQVQLLVFTTTPVLRDAVPILLTYCLNFSAASCVILFLVHSTE